MNQTITMECLHKKSVFGDLVDEARAFRSDKAEN